MARGYFITFEGGEGAGKSTQIARLAQKLRDKRYPVVVTREPGGSPGAEAIRHVILSGAAEPFGPEMEALLFAAARSDHIEQLIRPALRRGKIVLCDRFVDSWRVYQGAAGNIDAALLDEIERVSLNGVTPDMTLIFDLDPEEGLRRASARRGEDEADRFEKETLAVHRRRRAGFSRHRQEGAEALRRHRRLGGCGGGRECGDRGSLRGDRSAVACRPGSGAGGLMFERIAPEQHDTLDGIPEPSENPDLFGHGEAASMLAAAYRAGKLPHALLFAGPLGIGKATLGLSPRLPPAEVFRGTKARRRSWPYPILPPPLFRQIAIGAHPSVVAPDAAPNEKTKGFKTVVTVDEIRRVNRFLSMTSHDGGYRVVIVDPADDMNVSAANALLKNLEEPPSRTVFILISHSPGGLLADDPLALPDGPVLAARRQDDLVAALSTIRHPAARRRGLPGRRWPNARAAACAWRSCSRSMAGWRSPRRPTTIVRAPSLDIPGAHRLADAVAGRDRAIQFDIFNRHVLDLLADAASAAALKGDAARAGRYSQDWQDIRVAVEETETYNLDRKQHALNMIVRLQDTFRM